MMSKMGRLLVLAGLAAAGLHAQVALTMATSNSNPVAGGLFFTYTITATNLGPAGPVAVNDFLPEGAEFLEVSVEGSSIAARLVCTAPEPGHSGSVLCSNAAFPAGGVATITIRAQFAANVSGVRENAADAVPAAPPFPTRAGVLQHVQSSSTVLFNMSGPLQAASGDLVTFRLQVTPTSSSSALGVLLEDTIPDGTNFVSVSATGSMRDSCFFLPDVNRVRCAVDEVKLGGSNINIVLQTDGRKLGAIVNAATLHVNNGTVTGTPASVATTVLKR